MRRKRITLGDLLLSEERTSRILGFFRKSSEILSSAISNILIASGSSYKYICSRLQAESSNVCGHYCIYFVLQRIKGRSMSDIVLDFNISNLYANDQLVYDFVNDVKK